MNNSNIDLDYDKMKLRGYPVYIMEVMRLVFEDQNIRHSNPRINGIRSVEFTLKQFIQHYYPCKIISVVRDGDYRLCIIWEEVAA